MAPVTTPIRDRLLVGTEQLQNGCWQWKGALDKSGYGHISIPGASRSNRKKLAHRVSYQTFVGPIPDGNPIDHLCQNRGCINPTHLEPVSQKLNNQRSITKGHSIVNVHHAKTHCPHGHAYDLLNTYFFKNKEGYTLRMCRNCNRLKQQKRRASHARPN